MSINKKEKEMLYIYKKIIFQERKNDFKKGKEMLYIYIKSYFKKENIND